MLCFLYRIKFILYIYQTTLKLSLIGLIMFDNNSYEIPKLFLTETVIIWENIFNIPIEMRMQQNEILITQLAVSFSNYNKNGSTISSLLSLPCISGIF